jgi:hypothetical protein
MSEMWTRLQYLVLTLDLEFGPASDFISSFFDAIRVSLMRTSHFLILECNGYSRIPLGWGFVALTKDHPSKISWMKWLQ